MENGQTSKPVVISQAHDMTVKESTATILVGGKDITYKKFEVPQSAEMTTYLNQQSLIQAVAPLVDDALIEESLSGLTGLVMQSGNTKKSMGKLAKTIMSVFMTPDPVKVFRGQCDPKIDKKVCSGAIMSRLQKDLPSVIPSLFMGNMFGDDDDESDMTSSGNVPPTLL
jgi:hypothetical protein